MYKLGFVVVALVAACGESTHVSTSSVPPSGNGADGGVAPATPDAGPIGVDAGAIHDAGVAEGNDGGGATDAGVVTGGDGGVATCTLSGPTKLATAHFVIKMLVDGDQLYFLDLGGTFTGLYRVPKTGGMALLLAGLRSPSDDGAAWDFALGDTSVYLISSRIDDGFGLTRNGVTVIDKLSGTSRFVTATSYGCPIPTFMRVTATGATAWLAQDNHVPGFPDFPCKGPRFDTVEVLPPGATQPRTIVTQAGGNSSFAPGIGAIDADATHLFWSGAHGTYRARHDGSGVELLAPVTADQLAADGQTLFAVIGTSVVAISAPQTFTTIYDGTSQGEVFGAFATVLALDDTRAWVATPSGVIAVGKDGASPRLVVPADHVSTVAVDGTQVYYATGSSIMTACK